MGRRELTEEEKGNIQNAFYRCDQGHKGFLSREDVKVAMVSLFGYKPSKNEVDEIFGVIASESQCIKIDHFTEEMTKKMLVKDEDEEIRQTFLSFDSQCRGFLTFDDLKRVFAVVAPHFTDANIKDAFREIDRDGDGRVSYKDFEFMMKFNCTDG